MIRSRRAFLWNLPVLGALPAAWTVLAPAAAGFQSVPGPPTPANEPYWRMVKRQFPLEDGLVYLNAANVCPASRPVLDRHQEFLRDF